MRLYVASRITIYIVSPYKKDVVQVVDPVLLYSRENWDTLISNIPCPKEKYVVSYMLSKESEKYCKKIADSLQLKVYSLSWDPHWLGRVHFCFNTGPAEFINFIKNAEFVITSSFHATAFSAIYHKKIIYVLDGNASRIVDFVSSIGMESCIHSVWDENWDNDEVDWNLVDEKIREKRDYSILWLTKSIKQIMGL